ncbi:MAG: nitroreductase family protein [Fidelibacterota bacterium]
MNGKLSPLMNIILKRRSVRRYKSDEVEDWKIMEIMEAARLAPSACNSQCWRFIIVNDEEIRDKLVKVALGGIVPNRWAKDDFKSHGTGSGHMLDRVDR